MRALLDSKLAAVRAVSHSAVMFVAIASTVWSETTSDQRDFVFSSTWVTWSEVFIGSRARIPPSRPSDPNAVYDFPPPPNSQSWRRQRE